MQHVSTEYVAGLGWTYVTDAGRHGSFDTAAQAISAGRKAVGIVPTEAQIRAVAERLAKTIGGAVHLHATDVMHAVDAEFPGMTDGEFASVRNRCVEIAEELKSAALTAMWTR